MQRSPHGPLRPHRSQPRGKKITDGSASPSGEAASAPPCYHQGLLHCFRLQPNPPFYPSSHVHDYGVAPSQSLLGRKRRCAADSYADASTTVILCFPKFPQSDDFLTAKSPSARLIRLSYCLPNIRARSLGGCRACTPSHRRVLGQEWRPVLYLNCLFGMFLHRCACPLASVLNNDIHIHTNTRLWELSVLFLAEGKRPSCSGHGMGTRSTTHRLQHLER